MKRHISKEFRRKFAYSISPYDVLSTFLLPADSCIRSAIMQSTHDNQAGGMRAFFNPRSIAVIGASDDPARIGGRTISNLIRGHFAGPIYPINPSRSTIQGLKAYATLDAVPADVDCAIIALPVDLVLNAARQCANKGVAALVIFSAGFNEAGRDGEKRQQELREIANAGMRIIGPNCLGAFNSRNGAWLSFTTMFQEPNENACIGIVSQSGGSAAHILKLAQKRGLAISSLVTTGNEVDVDFGEALKAMAYDDSVRVIAGYIEGIRNKENLLAGLRAAHAARKPVVLLKVGRTDAGAKAAASHTASMAGEDLVYDTVFNEFGVYRARTTEELLDVVYAASNRPLLGRIERLGVVTISGGMGAQIADAADDCGISLPSPPDDVRARLKTLCPPGSPDNPVDITAQLSTDPGLLTASIRALIGSGQYDAILAFFGVYASVPSLAEQFAKDLEDLHSDHPAVPIVLSIVCDTARAREYMDLGYLVFEEPARAIVALAALNQFASAFVKPLQDKSAPVKSARIEAGHAFDEREAKAILTNIGIFSPSEITCASPDEIATATTQLRYPVALKILSPDITHKTDVGGVVLGLETPDATANAARDMLVNVRRHAPGAHISGFLISEMIGTGPELIVGTRRDPLFGTLVMVGTGGVTAELIKDVTLALAPVDRTEAEGMLRRLRCFELLNGYRATPDADLAAAIDTIVAISRLAAANPDTLETVEINPLRVMPKGQGAYALDAVIETVGTDHDN
ncbi:CoA-binding protein [Croceicoccus ponticola]|uniref:CoA-binding protein n=1 Tax=Croceicoccus ponticola TaxID=2217664 RepID=A0A437H210_9SPHN|nr:acetate--CoA ligase family protein [Croceicoccus ponticola]RVQ69665.1 CoA-binding protein [Croceicoccus ponticola]